MLKITDLKVNYGGIEAVKGISFEVPEKSIIECPAVPKHRKIRLQK